MPTTPVSGTLSVTTDRSASMLAALDRQERQRTDAREAALIRLARTDDRTLGYRAIVSFLRSTGEHDLADAFLEYHFGE